ncbi:MAG: carboxylating nicotinate-nucleotide diphosphorylase [Thermoplasmata archaeon]|nr:carboxylating nicotinate-nucleotide diphosphorylase [Thermoplasmata archaeon]
MRRSLREDRADRDVTSRALLPGPVPSEGRVIAQAEGVVSGLAPALEVARELGLSAKALCRDGQRVRPGIVVLRLRGDARRILAGERTILNFLMHLSGVASATAKAVRAAGPLEVYATRKTLPGLRDLEKTAVVHGGGRPHRRDLSSSFLIKNNHLVLVPLAAAIERARARRRPGAPVEVEVRSSGQAIAAARSGADLLLIDNASPAKARSIVRALEASGLRRGRVVELSGGLTAENLRRYRRSGADRASLGSLTHSARALPFHLVLSRRPVPRHSR